MMVKVLDNRQVIAPSTCAIKTLRRILPYKHSPERPEGWTDAIFREALDILRDELQFPVREWNGIERITIPPGRLEEARAFASIELFAAKIDIQP